MPKRYIPRDVAEIQKELEGENDRAAILVGAAMADHGLEQCIKSRLRPAASKTEESMLFTEGGIFGNYKEKVLAAYFMRLIGPLTKKDLGLVGSIRNQTAHDMNPISFVGTEEIRSRCEQINLAKESIPGTARSIDVRGYYTFTASFLFTLLMLRANDHLATLKEAAATMAPWPDR